MRTRKASPKRKDTRFSQRWAGGDSGISLRRSTPRIVRSRNPTGIGSGQGQCGCTRGEFWADCSGAISTMRRPCYVPPGSQSELLRQRSSNQASCPVLASEIPLDTLKQKMANKMSPGRILMNCRSSAFYSLYKTGFLRALTNRASGGVRYCILAYHGISRKPLSLFTSAPLFESHLRFFARWGVVTSMDEIAGYLRGERVLEGPNLRFVLTFDDGYANVVQNAAPLLRKHRQRGI